MSATTKKWLLLAGKMLFSGTLMFWLYRKIPMQDMRGLLASLDLRFLPLIVVLLLFNTAASALKWRLFLLADGVDIPLRTLTATYLIGSFYNLFLPSNIGGDSYRIYDIAKKSKSGVRSAASVFADRFSGFIALVTLSLLSSVLVARQFDNLLFFLIPLVILLLMLAVLAALAKEKPVRFFLALTRLDRFPLLTGLTEKFFLSFQAYGASRKLLAQVMAISFAFQLSVIVIVWLLALSLHAQVPFFYFSAFVPLITLLEALPISIFGLGLRDVGYVFFFGWTGMTELQTRSLALLFFAVAVSYSLIGGICYFWKIFSHAEEPVKNTAAE
ncbi:lysylphosphatidylglycerol synthase transmembrane domain-containing protein [Candidatus Electronema sp. JM]|uniref:lysylphosphatidylglycerol synthase transmembrane domain-containing protein n=1 Tax=Candidatus Electronema sp. JM TaxID=3401571 RepID=UPI003AA8B928